ncbi:hypothetical protein M378DRAFT_664947 [Amanita muscaria Koide BX008]|uniref:Uncharacterized protein n=1 Tax=Amanita muscaria (strain Koide BX008) TaxID=946122 RepID=A0A0C2X2X9_AMAMK|nr:hypothetical protein M378DRAFT_664947 [Amanita muscaria Koide BX008]
MTRAATGYWIIKRALSKWGHVDLVNISFKVIGERVVSPSYIVYLVVKFHPKSLIFHPSIHPYGDISATSWRPTLQVSDSQSSIQNRRTWRMVVKT